MRGKVAVIGDKNFVLGFNMAGIQDVFETKDREAQKKLEELFSKQEYAIIFIPESLFDNLDFRLRKKILSSAYPLVVPLPEYGKESKEGTNLKLLIKRALGFDLLR